MRCHDNPPGRAYGRPPRSIRSSSVFGLAPTPDRAPGPSATCVRAAAEILQPQVGVRERDLRGGGVAAPDRDLERGDRFLRTPGAKMNAPEQQLRLGFVGRQEHRAPQLGRRLAILLRLEQPPAALEMELRQLALIALGGGRDGLVDAAARASIPCPGATRSRPRGSAIGPRRRRPRSATTAAAPAPARAQLRPCCPTRRAPRPARHGHRRRWDRAAAPRAASRSPPADRGRARRRTRG